MSLSMSKSKYEEMIKRDKDWLKENTTDCIEQMHILSVLTQSVDANYPNYSKDNYCPDCRRSLIDGVCKPCVLEKRY